MKQRFWLKLSFVLFGVILFCTFSFFWFFCVVSSQQINTQNKIYVSKHISFLYQNIQKILKLNPTITVTHLQKNILEYFRVDRLLPTKNSIKPTVFIVNKLGDVLFYSKSNYSKKRLPFVLSLIKKNSAGWDVRIQKDVSKTVITQAKVITISLVKYFIVVTIPTQQPSSLFVSYFKWIVFGDLLLFIILLLCIFLYLKVFVYASDFLFFIFKNNSRVQYNKSLFNLTHTSNIYLKPIHNVLVNFLQKDTQTHFLTPPKNKKFSYIIRQAIKRSDYLYPHLQIHTNLEADLDMPILEDAFLQSIWELIKNSAQAFGKNQKGELYIRTIIQKNRWFCCEIEDTGPGMDKITIKKARELYFTTKDNATGLGLCFVESVLLRIGGVMTLKTTKTGGLNVCLFIPSDYIQHIHTLKEVAKKNINKIAKV